MLANDEENIIAFIKKNLRESSNETELRICDKTNGAWTKII